MFVLFIFLQEQLFKRNGIISKFAKSSTALSHSWFHCLSPRVWVSPLLSSPSDERLSKHRPTGLLIFIIHTSCCRLFSSIGWDFVTSWKKRDGVYLWKQGRHCWGLYLCLIPPPALTLGLRWLYHRSYIPHRLSVSEPKKHRRSGTAVPAEVLFSRQNDVKQVM